MDDINLYVYSSEQPLIATDPSGLACTLHLLLSVHQFGPRVLGGAIRPGIYPTFTRIVTYDLICEVDFLRAENIQLLLRVLSRTC